ncbi:MAG: xylose isomerase, partial [Acidimicrobiales bacterium]
MEEHLRFAVCYWHSFNWPGSDIFGAGTFDRPWLDAAVDPMGAAHQKMDAAFEFFAKLGAPFFSFHDRDIAPEGATFAESCANFDTMVDYAERKMADTGMKLLWGTAQAFFQPRYAAGAATNPNPDVFAHAAAQVKHCLDATHHLGGENYVLWGGREGYETLLNTDMARELDQLGRFLTLVVEHKKAIGFNGTILIEPKALEPTKHQYDYDSATVFGFLQNYGLENDIKVNIEVNHATLAGHDFNHEVHQAVTNGIFGSVDANRGDDRLGWDTDQFPNSVEQMSLGVYEILKGGGFTTGGFMFDTKLRRQSLARSDLFHGHVGAMDTLARSLLVAAALIEDGDLAAIVEERYAGWGTDRGQRILAGEVSLAELHAEVLANNIDPAPVSGQQEMLENLINRTVERVR